MHDEFPENIQRALAKLEAEYEKGMAFRARSRERHAETLRRKILEQGGPEDVLTDQ